MNRYGGMIPPVAAITTLLFCAFLALFPASVAALQAKVKTPDSLRLGLFIPALWVAFEWLRGWIFTGFPWLTLGYTQTPFVPFAAFAPVLGVYGISLLCSICAGMLAILLKNWFEHKQVRLIPIFVISLILIGGWIISKHEWSSAIDEPITVSLLQGNIPQEVKWREDRIIDSMQTYHDLTFASKSQLIVFPETALPLFLHQVPPYYLRRLGNYAKTNKTTLLIGLPEATQNREQYFNSVFSLDGGKLNLVYRKSHLVPFGEFLPLRPLLAWVLDILHIPLSDFSVSPDKPQPTQIGSQLIAINICYEDLFGEEIIRQLPQATLLLNVSNTAWFGESLASDQHLQIAQMRALETSRYVLTATNTGVTAMINEHGKVIDRAPQFVKTALHVTAQGRIGTTPYIKYGNSLILIIVGLSLAIVLIAARRKSFS
jgi:apolipoprotein N-acyltransferase